MLEHYIPVVSVQGDESVLQVDLGDAVVSGGHVTQVSGVSGALGVGGGTVGALVGVEVGPGRGAAVGGVSKLVDVEPVIAGLQSRDLASHGHGAGSL